MAYNISKKITVGLAKIYTQLADYLYLRWEIEWNGGVTWVM